MSYNFIENKYPYDDPNINLNFDDDITYQYLNGDYDIDVTHNVASTVTPNVPPRKAREKQQDIDYKKDRNDSSYVIYTMFILVAILIVILWYIYQNSQPIENITDISSVEPQLVMISPGFNRY
jgi:hypothetical protein